MLEALAADGGPGMSPVSAGVQLMPVLYDEAEQHAFIEAGVNAMAANLRVLVLAGHLDDGSTISSVAAKAWHSFMMASSPVIKHHGFASEAEWRIIKPVFRATAGGPTVDVRVSRGRLIPYVEVEAPLGTLAEIWSGPTNPPETVDAVSRLLAMHKIPDVKCLRSELPFRAV